MSRNSGNSNRGGSSRSSGSSGTRAPMREPGGVTAPSGRSVGGFINDSFATVTQANPPNRAAQMALAPGRGSGSVAMGGNQRMLSDGTVVSLSPAAPPQAMREPNTATQAFRAAIKADPKSAASVARTIPARDVNDFINSKFAAATQANPVNPAQLAGRPTFAPSQMPPARSMLTAGAVPLPPARPSLFAGNIPMPPARPTTMADMIPSTAQDPLGFASVSPRSPLEARPGRGPGVASAALAPPVSAAMRSPFANRGAPSGPDDNTGRMVSGALTGALSGGLMAGIPGAIVGGVMGGYDGARPQTMADRAQTAGTMLAGPSLFSPSTWFSGTTGGALSGPLASMGGGGAAVQAPIQAPEQVTQVAAIAPVTPPVLPVDETRLTPEQLFLRRITRRA